MCKQQPQISPCPTIRRMFKEFFLHVISMRLQPGRSVGIQGQSGYVTGNWVYMEMIRPFFPAAVLRCRLQTGLVVVHSQLSHPRWHIVQFLVPWEMPAWRLCLILGRFSDVQHTGCLEVLQGPWLDCVKNEINKLKPPWTCGSTFYRVLGNTLGPSAEHFQPICKDQRRGLYLYVIIITSFDAVVSRYLFKAVYSWLLLNGDCLINN